MKKIFATLLVMCIGVVAVYAQSGPKFEFSDGTTHDFGEVKEGPKAVHIFKFKNTGNEPLIIQTASASCGCTVPSWPKQPILPGKEGELKVEYNTQGRVGPINKDIYIMSNAVNNPDGEERYILKIKGMVVQDKDAAN